MSAPILTFFNNKGGVGKTSLVYHLAYMLAKLEATVLVVDLDPQANLTASFLDEDTIADLWDGGRGGTTVYKCVEPLSGVGDIAEPEVQKIRENLFLLPGDISLSRFEDMLSDAWPKSLGSGLELFRHLRILTSFWQVINKAVQKVEAAIVLVDVGPNLGAINRSVLLSSDFVAIPMGADMFSLQGLKNLGPTLRKWKKDWSKRLDNWKGEEGSKKHPDAQFPSGRMELIGYLCQQYGVRLDRPIVAYDRWVRRIPDVYRSAVLGEPESGVTDTENDPYCLATVKHYRSLVPMAQEVRKPIFDLTSADGAIGSHAHAAMDAGKDFKNIAEKIASKVGLSFEKYV